MTDQFHCGVCGRFRALRLLSDQELVDSGGGREPVCVQCEGFLRQGLVSLTDKVDREGKHVEPARRRTSAPPQWETAPPTSPAAQPFDVEPAPAAAMRRAPIEKISSSRAASATERDAFTYRSLAVERYIEGYVKGLEAGGFDRERLELEANQAVNNLLTICHSLGTERRKVSAGKYPRADVRRLMRHMDETSLMVDEYIRAVTEALERALQRRSSRPSPRRSR